MIPFIILLLNYLYFFKKIRRNYHLDYNIIGAGIYKLFSFFLKFEQRIVFDDIKYDKLIKKRNNNISTKKDYANINRILLISNHLNILDCVNVQNFISMFYANYMPVYIMTEATRKIPGYGKWVGKHCILIKNNIIYDKKIIEDKCKLFYKKSLNGEKYIFILFPEGCIRNTHNISRNNIWCKKNNIHPFKNLINPRKTGFDLILNNFKPQKLLLNSMY